MIHPVLITPEGRLLTEQPSPPITEESPSDSMGDLFKMAAEEAKRSSTNKETKNV